MADSEKEKQLDELLDSCLSSYSAVEPRPGYETRMQAVLREQLAKEHGHIWRSFWIVGAAAAVGAVVVFIFLSLPPRPVRVGPIPTYSAQTIPGSVLLPGNAAHEHLRAQVVKPKTKPGHSLHGDTRPALFPTPAPLSEQEKLLVHYMSATPREELIAQSRPDDQDQQKDDGSPDDHTQIPQSSSNARQGENL